MTRTPEFELADALNALYDALSVTRETDGHTWYGEEVDDLERRLKTTKRREVSLEDIQYLFINNCDSVQSVKYFLPRALEWLARPEGFYLNGFFVALKLKNARIDRWPEAEREAVVRVLRAMRAFEGERHIQFALAEFEPLGL